MDEALFDLTHDPIPSSPRVGLLRRADWLVQDAPPRRLRALVARGHYTGSASRWAVYTHGLYERDSRALKGGAWWIPPTKGAAIATYDGDWRRVLALSRLVVHESVPSNGASYLLAASTRIIRRAGAWDCLVTYADESQGHTGAIYLAAGWEYVGMTAPEAQWADTDGRYVARMAAGGGRTVREMQALGYVMIGRFAKRKFRLVLR